VQVAGALGADRLEQLVDQDRAHGALVPSRSISRCATPAVARRGLTCPMAQVP
jgi:hypothetical protein